MKERIKAKRPSQIICEGLSLKSYPEPESNRHASEDTGV